MTGTHQGYKFLSRSARTNLPWGNQHDSITFAQALQELTRRYQALARHCQSMTWIFDKGNNSARNQEILDASRFHFVGSLIPTHFTDLLALPVEKFQKLKDARLKSTRALRLTRQVWGQERTLVITFSPELQRKQIRGIEQHLSKKRRALEELQAKLRRSQPCTRVWQRKSSIRRRGPGRPIFRAKVL